MLSGVSCVTGRFPRVYVYLGDMSQERISVAKSATKIRQTDIEVVIEVWGSGKVGSTNASEYVDTLADEIIQDLKNPDSTDGTTTIKAQLIRFQELLDTRTEDELLGPGYKLVVRKVVIRMLFKYIGG